MLGASSVVDAVEDRAVAVLDAHARAADEVGPFARRDPGEGHRRLALTPADGEGQRALRLVPVGPFEDAGLTFDPARIRLFDIGCARCEDVEDETAARFEELASRLQAA